MNREEYYANLLKERGWERGIPGPYFTGNQWVSLSHPDWEDGEGMELRIPELKCVNTWAFWKALGIEYRLLREKVQTDLMSAFEEAARFGIPLRFNIPPEWAEAQRLEEYQLEVFAELQMCDKQEIA